MLRGEFGGTEHVACSVLEKYIKRVLYIYQERPRRTERRQHASALGIGRELMDICDIGQNGSKSSLSLIDPRWERRALH